MDTAPGRADEVGVAPFKSSIIALLLLATGRSFAEEPKIEEAVKLAKIFQEHRARGTFVLFDAKTEQFKAHDPARAIRRFIPASTFKIPNTLIGLETGAVKSVDQALPYGGKPQPFPQWEHDMPLREAIRISAVPIYQELARRIGLAQMDEWVTRLNYGNAKIGKTVDRFWLDGPLEISALEQARFLARLVEGQLPVQPATIAAVKEITLLEKSGEYELHGKTGWCTSVDPHVGWWVGWIERGGLLTSAFALNMDLPGKDDAAKRIPIGRACLNALGAFPRQNPRSKRCFTPMPRCPRGWLRPSPALSTAGRAAGSFPAARRCADHSPRLAPHSQTRTSSQSHNDADLCKWMDR
jgi:beta-lactamase class D